MDTIGGSSTDDETDPNTSDESTTTVGTEPSDSTTNEETTTSKEPKGLIDDFEDLSKWDVKKGRLEPMKEDAYEGSQSAALKRTGPEPVIERAVDLNAAKANLSLAVNLNTEEHAVLDVRLINENQSNEVVLAESVRASTSGFWHRLDMGATGVSGLPDLSNVTKIRIRMRGGGDGGSVRIDDLKTVPTPDKGYVAVVFDDAQESDYTKGFEILKQYDIPATSAIVTDHVGDDGFLSLDQMKEMKQAGWEMASHSATHANLLNASRLEAEREVVNAKEWLVENGFETGAQNFVYPYGLYDNNLLSFVEKYHDMGFGFFSTRNAANGYITDPMTISRGDGRHIEKAKSMVDLAHLYNDLEIITFHGIDRGGKFDVTSDEFAEFAEYLNQANVKPITLSQVKKKFQKKSQHW
ncbi:polysaccharide deacetylase family protein [Halorubellus litoreus]|uniref:Polysaccharide deacetylase family protein n=1 Tax=Halorubellus litoreus TaxID=755308 RepID=A0ABD5VIK6_9EURY